MLREFLTRSEITEVCELRGRFGVMAYHGGNLERTTDAVAGEVARRTSSSFYAVIQDPPHRTHIASTAFDPGQSEALRRFLDHVDVVITVHGYGRRRLWRHLLLGGRNRQLARHVAGYLRARLGWYRVLDDLDSIPVELARPTPEEPGESTGLAGRAARAPADHSMESEGVGLVRPPGSLANPGRRPFDRRALRRRLELAGERRGVGDDAAAGPGV